MANFLGVFFFFLAFSFSVFAKDFGVVGHTFPILEEDFLKHLQGKLQGMDAMELEKLSKSIQDHYVGIAKQPKAVILSQATAYRVYDYDPTIVLSKDIYDHEGRVIVEKGAKINPLHFVPLGEDLLFFDGTNERHINWARQQSKYAKWILIKGSPLDVEKMEGRPVYFDQFGAITTKFGIKNIPARVSQEENVERLKIEEIPLCE